MAMRDLSLGSIQHVAGGTVDATFQQQLKRVIEDCGDRPGEKKARQVILIVNVTPIMLQDGAAYDVSTDYEIKSTIPTFISRPVECRVKTGGRAIFNDLSEGNVDQMTIDEISGE